MATDVEIERLWTKLLLNIEAGRVIPVIGQELLTLEVEGRPVRLYSYLAQRLAQRLGLPDEPASHDALNQVACRYLAQSGDIEDVYPALQAVMSVPEGLPTPEPLRKLADIRPFKLFVTTTFDPLLAQAINAARFSGNARTQVFAYSPQNNQDLPSALAGLGHPAVFHLFGRLSAIPDYAVTDEDVLEFMHALQSETRRPARLFDELVRQNLLIMGCAFSDWLTRFFIRLGKRERLSLPDNTKTDFVCDARVENDPGLVLFLQHFSTKTKVFPGGSVAFIDELYRRWTAGHPAEPASIEPPAPRAGTGTDMIRGAVFLSYASEDRAAVEAINNALEAAGIDVWFDRHELHLGDAFEVKILTNIENCSVFIPVISRSTLTENPRFFRKEWRRAEQVAIQMPPNRRFVAPIAIDDTAETAEALPESFRKIQWVRLPGGKTTPEFVAEVRELFRAYQKSGANAA